MFDAMWLRGLGETGLAELLTRRPEALVPPPPSLVNLAEQLSRRDSVIAAMRRLDLPTLQVAEALAALGVRVDRGALAETLGHHHSDALDVALSKLIASGLVEVDRDGRLCLAPAAASAWHSPLDVGPPAAGLLLHHEEDEIAAMLRRHGHDHVPRGEMAATMVASLSDSARVRKIVAEAPHGLEEILRQMAARAPLIQVQETIPAGHGIRWPMERGLLLRANRWSEHLIMPAEVCLALRGDDYRAPFDPEPPPAARVTVDPGAVTRDAIARAADFMRLVMAMLDEAGRKPITRLRDGGVGPRELKRLAKAHGASVEHVRLALEVSHAAGLLSMGLVAGGQPTEEYDDWLELEPAEGLAALVRAWWFVRAVASRDEGPWLPDLHQNGDDIRVALFRLAAQPSTEAFADIDGLVNLLGWSRPLISTSSRALVLMAEATWQEAQTLGLVGAGVLSPAGRALLNDVTDEDALVTAFAGIGGVQRQAHLQADLTALVAGTPAPDLAALLNSTADREVRGTASTWRFGPGSIRRALDTGHTADDLLHALSKIAVAGVPQALEYLICDVQRRHGSVRVCQLVSCLRSDDTALLAEITADSKLRALGLRLLAPTVVASMAPLQETLSALRKAGYAPLAEGPDGTAIVERPPTQRAGAPARGWRGIDPRLASKAAARQTAGAAVVIPTPRRRRWHEHC
jgi:hypothetical protein